MEMNKKITKYLNGEMDAQTEKVFEQELRNNKDLRSEYELHNEIQNALGEEDIMELRERLEEYGTSGKTKKKKSLKWADSLTAAALTALFIGVGILWIYHSQITNSDELYANYFEPYPSIYSQRSIDVESESGTLKRKAFLAYEKENWRKAQDHFNELLLLQPENTEYAFYGGMLDLKLDKSNEAIKHFRTVLHKEELLLEDQAIWYIALAHLKEENIEKSIEYLQEIVREDLANKDKALKLLRRIE